MKLWHFIKKNKIVHEIFEAGVTLKFIDGILEVLGGLLLAFINPNTFNNLVVFLTQGELSEDPHDWMANYLLHLAHSFTLETQIFVSIYLILHGSLKIFLVINLWEKRLWAYPAAMSFFVLFIGFQSYRYFLNHSVFLLALTVLDIFVVIFTWIEYVRLRNMTEKI